jgi:hypothetical protein
VRDFILHSAFASRHGRFIKDFLDDRFAGFSPATASQMMA